MLRPFIVCKTFWCSERQNDPLAVTDKKKMGYISEKSFVGLHLSCNMLLKLYFFHSGLDILDLKNQSC